MIKAIFVFCIVLICIESNAQNNLVKFHHGKIYKGESVLKGSEYKELIKDNAVALTYLKKRRTAIAFAYPMAFIGGLGLGYGAGGLLFNKSNNLTTFHTTLLGGGIFISAAALILEAVSVTSLKNSIAEHNKAINKPLSFEIKNSSNQIGLVMNF